MNKLKSLVAGWTTPSHLTPEDGIHYWQEKVLLTLLLFGSILGFVTWIPSVALSVKEGLWFVAIMDTVILLVVLYLFLRPGLPYRIRAAFFPLASYVLGLILVATIGPFGAGPVWLFFFPILTGVLLGKRPAAWALVLNFVTVMAIGFLIQLNRADLVAQFHFKTWHLASENPVQKWVVICFNFMLLDILATVSVTMILNGLHQSLLERARSEKKYRRIFENILDVYFETNLDGTILEISPSVEPLSGYSQKELKGSSILKVYEAPALRSGILKKLIQTGAIKDHEILLKDRQGITHTCSVNARLVRSENGEPDRIIGIFRDISEQKANAETRKELEERLNRVQKMEALGLLAGGVAHDLNNVLSGIVTYPEIMMMELPEDSPMTESLNTIHASGLRAAEIVQDLLTLSRRGVMTRKVLDLNDIVNRFLATPEYEKILSYHPRVDVKTDLSARHPMLKGSAVHLQKSVMNLVSNAAEAQPDGGVIRISTRNRRLNRPIGGYDHVQPGTYIVLTVADNGTGIDPDDMKRIFEPFFTKKVMGRSGTGLGMAVVWGTVQDHGGYIDVISDPGTGTRFDLYFPVTSETVTREPAPLSLDRLLGNGEKIVIVDDVAAQRRIAAKALARLGYDALALASGEDAVRYMQYHDADLLILDMIMDPGIDGLETYRRILAFKPRQKAIIASGFSRTQKVDDVLALGAGQYLKKPYSLEELGLAVQQELAK